MEDYSIEDVQDKLVGLISDCDFLDAQPDDLEPDDDLMDEVFITKEDFERYLDIVNNHFDIELERNPLRNGCTLNELATLVHTKIG